MVFKYTCWLIIMYSSYLLLDKMELTKSFMFEAALNYLLDEGEPILYLQIGMALLALVPCVANRNEIHISDFSEIILQHKSQTGTGLVQIVESAKQYVSQCYVTCY